MVKSCFIVAVRDWRIPPRDFWSMTAEEWFWLYNASRPIKQPRLTADEYDDCLATLNGE